MIKAKKSLGQNFLIDKNIIRKIINLVKLEKKNIIEIGAGHGALTDEILKKKPNLLNIIDKDIILYKKLKIKYSGVKNVKLFNDDILDFDLESLVKKNSIIIGNLPYNISSQILVKILRFKKWPPNFENLIFMFQKELGEKILGVCPSVNYGRLSILSNYRLNFLNKFLVSKNCFFPKPKIDSTVLLFQPINNKSYVIKDIENLEKVTQLFFSNKRKMINKTFKKLKINNDEFIKNLNIDLTLRPEKISENLFYKITEFYEKKLIK